MNQIVILKEMKLNKTASSVKSPSISLTAHSTPRNLHIAKAPGSAPAALCSESQSPAFLGTPSSTLTSSPHSGTYTLFLLLWSRNQTITRILIYTVFWGWSHWNQGLDFRLRKVSMYFQRIWLTTIFILCASNLRTWLMAALEFKYFPVFMFSLYF